MSPDRATPGDGLGGALPEESAEDLYEHAPCGYLSTLPNGTIARVNATFLAWTGYRREDLVGRRRFAQLLTPGGKIYHETHYAPLLRMQGAVREIALDIVCADGRRLPVLVNSTLRRDAEGRPLLVRTTVFDATDRKEYERELLRARDRERAARERTEQLQRITAVLAGALLPEGIGAGIVPELVGGTGAEHGALAVVGKDGRLRAVALGGEGEPSAPWEAGMREPDGPVGLALAAGSPRFEEDRGAGARPAALAVLPLDGRTGPLGVLWLGFREPRSFDEEERAFLLACARQCAQALDRARLHERTAEAARRSAFHAEASRELDEVQGFDERAQRLLELVVRHFGGSAWLEVPSEGRFAAVAAADAAGSPPDELLRAPRETRLSADAAAAVEAAVATGTPHVVSERTEGAAGRPGARSSVALPLRSRGLVLGVLTVVRTGAEPQLGAADLPFLTELAERAALALENARLYEQERDVAHALQQSLLAGTPPQDPRFEVATQYRPGVEALEVGGDWYDTFSTGKDRIAVVVGDVVGRGIAAASAMGQLRSAVRALAAAGLGPARVIDGLDTFVAQVDAARWATLAYAEVHLATGRVRYATAGHPPVLLAAPGEAPAFLWHGRSAPLGVPAPDGRPEAELALAPGARLLLYTDGLVERRRRPLDAGLDRLAEELGRRRDTPLPALVADVADAMLAGEQHRDDVCLLCLALRPHSAASADGEDGARGEGRRPHSAPPRRAPASRP